MLRKQLKFTAITLFLLTSISSNAETLETPATAQFDQESNLIYQSLGTPSIPKEAFEQAYIAFNSLKAQGRLNKKPLITFVNFSTSSNRTRLFVVNIESKSVIFSSNVTHGKKSGGIASPAVNFSNVNNSNKSSLGFYITGERYSGKLGTSMRLDGVSGNLNSEVRPRAIVMHSARYAQAGGRSLGCLAVPPSVNMQAIELLKNKTLIYAFTTDHLAQLGDKASAAIASKDKDYDPPEDVSGVQPEFQEFENLPSLSKAIPAIAVVGAGAAGVTLLKGSNKYETCQGLSNKSWADTTKEINSGKDPSSLFTGAWGLLKKKVEDDEVDNDEAITLSQNQLSTINDCVAIAHVSDKTDFTKDDINTPESKSSSDGKIKCVYNTPESQDYSSCLQSITAYEALNIKEKALHAEQAETYKAVASNNDSKVNIDNAQSVTLDNATKLQENHSNIALARAEISNEKLNILAAISSKIPTRDSLYDDCKSKFNKHGVVSTSEYNEFVKMFSGTPVVYTPTSDHCTNAVVGEVKLVQNQEAKKQINEVLKQYGKERDDYTSTSNALLNQATTSFGNGPTSQINSFDKSDSSEDDSSGNTLISFDVFENQGLGSKGVSGNNNSNAQFNGVASNSKGYLPSAGNGSFSLSNFTNESNQDSDTSALGQSNGIFDKSFYNKINIALQDPSKLDELKLSPEQMKEYVNRKSYQDSLKAGGTNSRNTASTKEANAQNTELIFHSKELNIFQIISDKYKDVYKEVLREL